MGIDCQIKFCRNCQSKTVWRWYEPPHHLYSALTLSLIAAGAANPTTGFLMAFVWLQRLAATRKWACPHCQR